MLINKLKQVLSGQFIRNAGWLGGAELVNRIFRLATTVTLARTFTSYDYGLVAIIYTTAEFASVFTLKYGIGAKIVQADEQDIKTICDTSYWLNWILCGSIFIIQCIGAFPVAWFYKNNQIILPICIMALSYLIMPVFMVQSAMIQRENRLKITALCNALQALLTNILTVILALAGMGIWSVVLPSVLTTPVWIIITYRNHPWRPPASFKIKQWREVTRFGKNMLGVELLNKLRANLDYLIVGRFLGVEALGIYYFAFNAGLGISVNVMSALFSALFPYLCAARGNFKEFKQRYFSSLKTITMFVIPLILLQSALAPFYVPIIFGQRWIPAIPVLITICLSALPRPFGWATNLLLDAVDKTHITLYSDMIFTVIFTVSLLVAVKWGIFWVAAAVLISHMLVLPIFTIWGSRYVFSNYSRFYPTEKHCE